MRRLLKLAGLLALCAALMVLPAAASAGYTSITGTVNPKNVKMNFFDYWLYSENDSEEKDDDSLGKHVHVTDAEKAKYFYDNHMIGINKNHALLFLLAQSNNHGNYLGSWNGGHQDTHQEMVKPYLYNGYPQLNLFEGQFRIPNSSGVFGPANPASDCAVNGTAYHKDGHVYREEFQRTLEKVLSGGKDLTAAQEKAYLEESLAYLFDPANLNNGTGYGKGKRSYTGVTGLLQQGAYNAKVGSVTKNLKSSYFFDSNLAFAQLNKNSKKFNLYKIDNWTTKGFYPLDTVAHAANNFQQTVNGKTAAVQKHYFGLSMEVEFYQPTNGKLPNGDEMIFHFSGDDDVFIFVDDMLVANVGGIHGRKALQINFATGEVKTQYNNATVTESFDKWHSAAQTGLGKEPVTGGLKSLSGGKKTLKDNTKHTLRMFYLERGNYGSNLEIAFNLYYPYSDYTLENELENAAYAGAYADTKFPYALTFDKSAMDTTEDDAWPADNKYEFETSTGKKGKALIDFGSGNTATITSMEGGDGFFSGGKIMLADGESITFTLPNKMRVTSQQSMPDPTSVFEFVKRTAAPTANLAGGSPAQSTESMQAIVQLDASNTQGTEVDYVNRVLGSLTVTKTVAGYTKGDDPQFAFTVTIPESARSQSFGGSTSFSLRDGESAQITGIIAGAAYGVSEAAKAGFATTSTGASGTIYAGENTAAFTNTYNVQPTTVSIPVNKIFTVPEGLNAPDITGKFTFTLTASTGAPMPAVTELKNPDANGGSMTFGPITFAAPGAYTYTVTETGTVAGVTNDAQAAKTVTVTVVDNGDGTLTATADAENLTFTNAYNVGETSLSIPVEKTLSVPEGLTAASIANKFTFKLTGSAGAPMPATTSYTNPDANGGSMTFGPITFAAPGAYTYTVTETGTVAGVTNDAQAAKTVTVTVVDNGDGTLTATADAEKLAFTNAYSVDKVTAQFMGVKELTGRTLKDGEFHFELAAVTEGAPMPATTTVANTAAGEVIFDEIEYTMPGTYEYTITEKNEALTGIEYDETPRKVTVTVTDDGNGKLVAEGVTDELVWKNVYTPGVEEVVLEVLKLVNGAAPAAQFEGSFSFTLTAVGEAPMPEINTAVNGAGGMVQFGKIIFDKVGEFRYEITENVIEPAINGMFRDERTIYAQVNVTYDPDQGKFLTETVYSLGEDAAEDAQIAFDNEYAPPKLQDMELSKRCEYEHEEQQHDGSEEIPTVLVGDTIPYVISVKNNSRADMRDIVISDKVPQHTEYVPGSGGELDENNTVWFKIEKLGPGESAEVRFAVKTLKADVDVRNIAYVGTPDVEGTLTPDGQPTAATNEVVDHVLPLPNIANTGDASNLVLCAAVLAVSAGGVILLRKRRKNG